MGGGVNRTETGKEQVAEGCDRRGRYLFPKLATRYQMNGSERSGIFYPYVSFTSFVPAGHNVPALSNGRARRNIKAITTKEMALCFSDSCIVKSMSEGASCFGLRLPYSLHPLP